MDSKNIILIIIIAALIVALVFVSTRSSNSDLKKEIQSLTQQNKELEQDVKKSLEASAEAQKQAARYEALFAADTVKLLHLQKSFASISKSLDVIKQNTHDKVATVLSLNDTSTIGLFQNNINRFR